MKLDLDLNKKYLLGLSMGSDSLALFYLLKKQGYDFCVAHVNYHHRKEADEETEALINLCKLNNIKYFVKHAYYDKGNFEDFARNVRYEFFAEIINSEKLDYLVVAHNLNDLIETYYLQKKRKNYVSYFSLNKAIAPDFFASSIGINSVVTFVFFMIISLTISSTLFRISFSIFPLYDTSSLKPFSFTKEPFWLTELPRRIFNAKCNK